ncbi:hypothetical protein GCM10009735_17770 [Actinomadura chokoriensis]
MDDVVRPVLDPELPKHDRELLTSCPAVLTAASRNPPGRPWWGGRGGHAVADSFQAGVVCGLLPAAALPFLYGWCGGAVGAVLQAWLVWVLFDGLGSFLLTVTVL